MGFKQALSSYCEIENETEYAMLFVEIFIYSDAA